MAAFFFFPPVLGVISVAGDVLCTALPEDRDFQVGESSEQGVGVWRRRNGFPSVRRHWFVWFVGPGHGPALRRSRLTCVFPQSPQTRVPCVPSYRSCFDVIISVMCRISKCVSNTEGSPCPGASARVPDVNTVEVSLETF